MCATKEALSNKRWSLVLLLVYLFCLGWNVPIRYLLKAWIMELKFVIAFSLFLIRFWVCRALIQCMLFNRSCQYMLRMVCWLVGWPCLRLIVEVKMPPNLDIYMTKVAAVIDTTKGKWSMASRLEKWGRLVRWLSPRYIGTKGLMRCFASFVFRFVGPWATDFVNIVMGQFIVPLVAWFACCNLMKVMNHEFQTIILSYVNLVWTDVYMFFTVILVFHMTQYDTVIHNM